MMNDQRMKVLGLIAALLCFAQPRPAQAAGSAIVRETAEQVMQKFARESAGQTVETVSARLTSAAAQYGDDAVLAVGRVGPRGLQVMAQAGANGSAAARLMARYGDEGIWILSRPRGAAIFARYGDDGARAMIRHPGVAEPLIERLGAPAVHALRPLNGQSARRLAMLADDGALSAARRGDDVLAVVERYGNRGMDFIWRNKGALTVGAALTAFLADPEPFISGTRDLAEVASSPIAQAAAEVGREMGRRTNWTGVSITLIAAVASWAILRMWMRRNSMRKPAHAG
jgi:hypothetical protein